LRRVLDGWSLLTEEETIDENLSRLLIAFDELRARLEPSKYPSIEVSDEGHLYFTIDTSMGTIEVIAFPFGFKKVELSHPFWCLFQVKLKMLLQTF
jgi:hypothetical protein